MYVVYDETGMIKSTIMGPDETYGDILTKEGKTWLFHQGVTTLDPRYSYVDIASKTVVLKPSIILEISKSAIKADGVDITTLSGIPKGSMVNIYCNGQLVVGETVDDGVVMLSATMAATYRVDISCGIYNPTSVEVVAS